jgi:thiol-disulfide isomerase/thioredoxin
MKKMLLIIAVAVIAGLFGLAASVFITGPGALLRTNIGQWAFQEIFTPEQDSNNPNVKIGQVVTPFSVLDFSGKQKQLPNRGRWQVINYWASWCEPCRKEMPMLNTLSSQSQGQIDVIGIALDDIQEAKAFLRTTPISFVSYQETPSQLDSSSRMGNAWGVLPFTVLVNPEGKLMRRHIGQFKNQQQLDTWVSSAMHQKTTQ